ncbi:heterokaryon incompatibility [Aaosphaeria arxii CBS 175.79]|uniref:Heterokaryon incompatibility n=1 Tax=Aaosphaeria arxii CBS 175.79 TaxID=1450172 RepID=A0A6A5XJR0_9PLEO|nr:heterokaryon incompatibility [Aaosphaeria arxii CBS 175.79]KAF2012970.1 heterokaryon incompatibility [Aaosphaeria arxii CBS 175.79]
MRLLRIDSSGALQFTGDLTEVPPYAILSHTWGPDGDEVTYDDFVSGAYHRKAGYAKIQFCGIQARRDNLEYFWVDSCCIDKKNFTELSEAITSMFRWYANAVKCYVYLPDVSTGMQGHNQTGPGWHSSFQSSRWFTRGWTLQELLAPKTVEFFSREGKLLGDRVSLEVAIQKTTGIPLAALRGAPLADFTIEERMGWAEERNTKKKEDRAYCLLGIFDIFMPLIYGEGDNAFARLRDAIHQSILSGENRRRVIAPGLGMAKVCFGSRASQAQAKALS